MTLGNFNDFVSSLKKEEKDYLFGLDNEDSLRIKLDLSDPNWMNDLLGFISSRSFSTSVRLLQLYHEWLQQKIDHQ